MGTHLSASEVDEILHAADRVMREWEVGKPETFNRHHYEAIENDLVAIMNDYRTPLERRCAAGATWLAVEKNAAPFERERPRPAPTRIPGPGEPR